MLANRQPPSPEVETPRHVLRLGRIIRVYRQRQPKKQPFVLPLRLKSLILLTLVSSGAPGLVGQKGVEKVNTQVPAPPTFVDVSQRSGIGFKHESKHSSQKYLLETMGAGVAAFDYNDDGLVDLFFVNAAELRDPMPVDAVPDKSQPRYWNRLYRNDGNGKFSDVTEAAGLAGHSYGMGVAVGDYDNDGSPDLYVTNFGANILYNNNGDGTFTDVTEEARVSGEGWSVSAAFVDYDQDSLLDLIVTRYLDWDFSKNKWCGEPRPGYRSYCHPKEFAPVHHLVYRNQGNGVFEDVSKRTGFARHPGKALGIALNDFDRDGALDIAVANDSFPQQLFHNMGNGTFTEIGLLAGIAYDEDGKTFAGMGIVLPSPFPWRVGIHDFAFEACSSFTRVTACRVARPPYSGLCHEASTRPVTRPGRSLATIFTDNYMGGSFPHWQTAPVRRTRKFWFRDDHHAPESCPWR